MLIISKREAVLFVSVDVLLNNMHELRQLYGRERQEHNPLNRYTDLIGFLNSTKEM